MTAVIAVTGSVVVEPFAEFGALAELEFELAEEAGESSAAAFASLPAVAAWVVRNGSGRLLRLGVRTVDTAAEFAEDEDDEAELELELLELAESLEAAAGAVDSFGLNSGIGSSSSCISSPITSSTRANILPKDNKQRKKVGISVNAIPKPGKSERTALK